MTIIYFSRPSQDVRPGLVRASTKEFTALRPHNDNVITRDTESRSPGKEWRKEAKEEEKKEPGDKEQTGDTGDRRQELGGFLEVTVKQEQEEEPSQETESVTESSGESHLVASFITDGQLLFDQPMR